MVPSTSSDTKLGTHSLTSPTPLVSPDSNPTIGPPTSNSTPTCAALIADTGSTAHFCTIDTPVINKIPAKQPIAIRNPNGSVMYSTHTAELDLPQLPFPARQVHIVPALAYHSLISIGQLCDAGCDVTFDAHSATVRYNKQIVLTGQRTATTKLWHLQLPATVTNTNDNDPPNENNTANSAVGSATPAEVVAFAHATLFSPALSTLEIALQKEFLNTFPGLTARSLRKHPPQSYPMVKGHLTHIRQNQRSTKPKPMDTDAINDCFPTDSPVDRSHLCYAAIMQPTGQIYTDQTGKFIAPSSNGNNYLMIVYDYDSNHIFAEPFKTRSASCILAAYKSVHLRLCAAGLRPKLQRLDNECSTILKEYLQDEDIDFQLVPPHHHRRNAAERAVRTFKDHFIAGMCSLDPDFPIHLWDRIVPQAIITLNLLRGSRINPKLSAWAQVHGNFDFNRTPLAPPGIRVLVHEPSQQRTTWSPHALDGWYTGPALHSYRCYTIWIWETRTERICDTVSWFPKKVTMPIASSNQLILAGIQDILHALQHPSPGSPLSPLTDSHVHSLRQLTTILTGIVSPTTVDPLPLPASPDNTSPNVLNKTPSPSLRVESPPLPAAALRVNPSKTATVPLHPSILRRGPSTKSPQPIATFDNSTGPTGKRRRRNQRKPTKTIRFKRGTKRSAATALQQQCTKSTASRSKTRHPKHRLPTHARLTRANPSIHVAAAATSAQALMALEDLLPHDHFALHGNAFNPDTGQIAEYRELSQCSDGKHWQEGCADEFGRLCQGRGTKMPTGTNTMFFIPKHQIPKHKKPTYLRIVAAYRPEKAAPHRVRFTCGGDKIEYVGDVSTKTADLTTVKCHLNDVVSTPNAKYMTADLSNFYLETPMDEYEYMRIPLWVIPEAIMIQYKLEALVTNGFVYVEIRKGMYGLPQSGRLANDRLIKFLAPHGYTPVPITPGLWKHNERPLTFTLVVDDFGVKYTSRDDADHLMTTLQQLYSVSIDWTGTKYCGIQLEWDYIRRTVDLSMPGYVARALQRFQHPNPSRPQHAPHMWQKPNYGAKTQYATPDDNTPFLDVKDTKRVQEVLGTFLYYARAVDSTMLVAIGEIATQQAKGTQATMQAVTHLLNYAATHPVATIRYVASDMCLHVDSDASYLSVSKARSRIAGFHYLSSRPRDPNKAPASTDPMPPSNGAVLTPCHIMRAVVSSAAEAELGGLFYNGKEACPIRITLEELGHPQPPTVIVTDNSTATGIANDSVKQKRSKAIDMRFYWTRDRVRQGQFHVVWRPGKLNKADYFTKHHPASHHQQIRSAYLHNPKDRAKNYFEVLQDSAPNRSIRPTAE
jgi:hypothetical protein